ncbi:MAG TPA: hypothetical protein DCR44_02890 [Acholeplasmatales bacterium]|nr:hypothetical protein [Acholeplasmatales bacterium]
MRLRILILFIFLFALVGCDSLISVTTTMTTESTTIVTTMTTVTTEPTTAEATTTTTLAPLPVPYDLELDDEELLTWTGFSPDASYIVEVDGVEYPMAGTEFDMSTYPDAVYLIRIRTVLGYRMSEFSLPVSFTILNHPEIPWNLLFMGNYLTWNETQNAIGYRVSVDEVDTDVADAAFDLTGLEANAFHTLSVRALYEGGFVSDASIPVYYHTYFTDAGTANTSFNKNAPLDVVCDFTEETWTFEGILFDDVPLDEAFYSVTDNILTFLDDYLIELPYDDYEFLVLTSEGYVTLILDVVDDRQPFMISSNQVIFTGSDIILTFEVYDGAIVSVSGNDITSADYLILGNTVTISAAYVVAKFNENPDRAVLILGYNVSANDYVSIGYVFIRLPA